MALLSTIALNCFAYYLTLKSKYLLIVPLRVYSLFTGSFISYRPDHFLTINPLLANVWSFFFLQYAMDNGSLGIPTILIPVGIF